LSPEFRRRRHWIARRLTPRCAPILHGAHRKTFPVPAGEPGVRLFRRQSSDRSMVGEAHNFPSTGSCYRVRDTAGVFEPFPSSADEAGGHHRAAPAGATLAERPSVADADAPVDGKAARRSPAVLEAERFRQGNADAGKYWLLS
jgi:hypothetical protein